MCYTSCCFYGSLSFFGFCRTKFSSVSSLQFSSFHYALLFFPSQVPSLLTKSNILNLFQVPCILGVVLNDIDLLEFLQQVILFFYTFGYLCFIWLLLCYFTCLSISNTCFAPCSSCCSLLIQTGHQPYLHLFIASLTAKHAGVLSSNLECYLALTFLMMRY